MQKFPNIKSVISSLYGITGTNKSDEIKTILKKNRNFPESINLNNLCKRVCDDISAEPKLAQEEKVKLHQIINDFIEIYINVTKNSSTFKAAEKQILWTLSSRLFIPYGIMSIRNLYCSKLGIDTLASLLQADKPITFVYYNLLISKNVATTSELVKSIGIDKEEFRQWLYRREDNCSVEQYEYLSYIFCAEDEQEIKIEYEIKLKVADIIVRAKKNFSDVFGEENIYRLDKFIKYFFNPPKDKVKAILPYLSGITDYRIFLHNFIDYDLYHSHEEILWSLPSDKPQVDIMPPSETDRVFDAIAKQAIREQHDQLSNTISSLLTKDDDEIDMISNIFYHKHSKTIFANCLSLYVILAMHRDKAHEKRADESISFLDCKAKYMTSELLRIYQLIKAEILFHKGKYSQATKEYNELVEKTENCLGWVFKDACNKGLYAASLADDKSSFNKIYKKGYWKLIFKEPYKDVDDYIYQQKLKDAKRLTKNNFRSVEDKNPSGIIDPSIKFSGEPNYKINENIGGKHYSYQIIEMVSRKDINEVKALINAGVDINKLDSDNGSAILYADTLEMLELLNKTNTKIINIRTKKLHKTPLSNAIDNCNPKIVKRLISLGADVNLKCTSEDLPPLHYVLSKLANIYNKPTQPEYGTNSYHREFAQLGSLQSLNMKNSRHREIYQKVFDLYFDDVKVKPLKEILTVILEQPDLDINSTGKNGLTPLILACEIGDLEIIDNILQLNPEINVQNNSGSTALHYTTLHKDEKAIIMAKLLLSYGANKKIADIYNRKPIDYVDKIKTPELYALLNR